MEVAPVAVPVVDPAGWAAPKLLGLVVPVSARVAGTGNRTRRVCLVIRRNARSAARRWCVIDELVNGARRRARWAPFCLCA